MSLGGSKTSKSSNSSSASVPRAPASPQEQMLTDIANQQWADYQARFMPLNQQVLDQVRVREGRDVKPALGRANADVRLALQGQGQGAAQAAMRGLGRAGSGRGLMAQFGKNMGLAQAMADAQGGAYRGALDQEFAGLTKLAAQGRDIQHDSVLSTAEAGERATRSAIAKVGKTGSSVENFSRPGENPWAGTLASIAGAGARYATDYIFGPPSVSSDSNVGTYGARTVYNDPGGYTVPLPTSGGGFLDRAGTAIGDVFSGGGSSGGIFSGGGSSTPFFVH